MAAQATRIAFEAEEITRSFLPDHVDSEDEDTGQGVTHRFGRADRREVEPDRPSLAIRWVGEEERDGLAGGMRTAVLLMWRDCIFSGSQSLRRQCQASCRDVEGAELIAHSHVMLRIFDAVAFAHLG